MSRLFTIAYAMRDRIEALPGLAGCVVVDRQNDLEAEFGTKLVKSKGKAVVIRLVSAKNPNRTHTKPSFAGTFTVTLFCSPLLTAKDAVAADDLMESIWTALHGWWPPNIPSNGLLYCDCQSVEYSDAPNFSVSRLTVESPRTTT